MRRLSCEHLVGDGAERVDVAAPIDHAVTRGLLGAHVLRGAETQARLRDTLSARSRDREGNAEIGDDRLPVLKKDVLGLEIAMNDAVLVCIVERSGDGDGDAHGVVHRQLTLTIEAMPQALALDEGHDIEEQPVRLATVEQRKQIRVLKIGGHANLGEKTLGAEYRSELGAQHLQCNVPLVTDVACEVHSRHTTATDLAFELVAIGQGGIQGVDEIHASLRSPRCEMDKSRIGRSHQLDARKNVAAIDPGDLSHERGLIATTGFAAA